MRLWSHASGHYLASSSAHPTLELAWVESGEIRYRIDSREHVVGPGEVMVVPRGVEHATGFAVPAVAGALALDSEMVAELADTLGKRALPREPAKVPAADRLVAIGKLVRLEVSSKESGYLTAVDALTEAMTIQMLRGMERASNVVGHRDARVRAVLELIHGSYAEPIGIDDLARAAGTSRFHMSRIFREATGQPPYQYLLRVRVERAAELLRGGRRTVTDVAISVGFPDLGRFARTFRTVMGVSPGVFAKSGRRRSPGVMV